MANTPYQLTKFANSPSTMISGVKNGDVKQEFKQPCWNKYMEVLSDLRYLARFHDISEVMEALKRDLGVGE